jgi:hypothetical protein
MFEIRLPRALTAAFVNQALKASEGVAGLSAAMRCLIAAQRRGKPRSALTPSVRLERRCSSEARTRSYRIGVALLANCSGSKRWLRLAVLGGGGS